MSRLSRVASETPVYFPSIVSGPSDQERKFTPIPPQKSRHHAKKHSHANDSRIQLEPLRPPSSSSGSSSARLSISLSADQVGLDTTALNSSSNSTVDETNIGQLQTMEKQLRFYRQLASLKLRDVVTTEHSVLTTIDAVLHACATALDADCMVLYSLNDATGMLHVTSCTNPEVVGFQVPLDKFAMAIVLESTLQQLEASSLLSSSTLRAVEPVYVANLQRLASYDASFDVDALAGITTTSILAGVIVDENSKPIFVVEARCAREKRLSNSVLRAGLATLENVVYQYDVNQMLARSMSSYATLDTFLQDAIMQPETPDDDDDVGDADEERDEISVALTSNVNREADPELEHLLVATSPNLKKLTHSFLAHSSADAVCLLKFEPGKQTCHVLASASAQRTDDAQLVDCDKLNELFASSMTSSQSTNDSRRSSTSDPMLPLFLRFIESIEKMRLLDLSVDLEFQSVLATSLSPKTAVFLPVPTRSSCAFAGLLVLMRTEQHVLDMRTLQPFASALGLATVMKRVHDDLHTSTIQKLKLIHLYNACFEVATINDPSTLVNMICDIGCETFNTARVTLYVADPIKRELWSLSTLGSVNGLRIPYGTGIAGTVASTREKLIVRNAYDDARFDRSFDAKLGFKTESLITFPVLDKSGATLGVVQAVNARGFLDPDAHPLIATFDARVLDVFSHMVSYTLQLNSSLIMFAKVQADYWANRAIMDNGRGDGDDENANNAAKHDVASVHSLLDTSGFDEAKRVPRNKWSTFAYAVWVLGKFLRAGHSRIHTTAHVDGEVSKQPNDAVRLRIGNRASESAASRARGRTSSVVRAGRASSLINRWRRLALSPSVDEDELLRDDFNPLTKSLDELKQHSFQLFEGLMLLTTFRIDATVLQCFIETIASRYRPVAYHSFYHGFDVALNAYCLIRKTSVINVIKEFEALSLMVAALGHDADHPGNDNQFEVDSSSPLALCYNDISVLENHHASTTFSVLRLESCNILKDLSASAKVSIRTAIVRCILATDMKHHSRLISDLAIVRDADDFEHVTDGRQLMMNMVIHGADLSSVAHPLPITTRWVELVCQEFTDQAKRSAELGIFVPPHIVNLEDDAARCRLQVNFIDYLVAPLWNAISSILPEVKTTYIYHLRANREYFFENAGQMSARRATTLPAK